MKHLRTFTVGRYRGIGGLSFPKLTRANLVTGMNGIGKTALLESMWLFSGRYNSNLYWNANVLRSREDIVNPIAELSQDEILLSGQERSRHLVVKATFEQVVRTNRRSSNSHSKSADSVPIVGRLVTKVNNKQIKGPDLLRNSPEGLVSYRVEPRPGQPLGIFVSTVQEIDTAQEVLQRYSKLVRSRGKSELESAMQIMFDGYQQVEILTSDTGKPYLAVSKNGDRPLPLRALGGGAVKFFSLYLNFFTAQNGLVFFDEIENGVHYSIFGNLWKCVREWTKKWNVQFFATTHSREFVHEAVDKYTDRPFELSVHKLFFNKKTDSIDAVTYCGESLLGAKDLDLEIR